MIKVGDEIYTGHIRGRGGHGAYVIVTKINRKSIKGVERERSYSPGTLWTIGTGARFAVVGEDEIGRRTEKWVDLGEYGKVK